MLQVVTITEPTTEPVTTVEAKLHLRVTWASDDDYIAALVASARRLVQSRTGMRLFTQTIEIRADRWADFDTSGKSILSLRTSPIQSVTSVKYYNTDDIDTTYPDTSYWEDLTGVPARIQIKNTADLPSLNSRIGNVRIRAVAGWATVGEIPEPFKTAIKLLVGHWYSTREESSEATLSSIPEGVSNLLMSVSENHHYDTGSM